MAATSLQIEQGTAARHDVRRQKRCASEAPAVLGVSPWVTPFQVWEIKCGKALPEPPNPAMLHGTRTEPLARAAHEERTGLVLQPLVLVDGEYLATLDGMTLDEKLVLEIKCPAKGKSSTLWQAVSAGNTPAHIRWQLQLQLMVSGAEQAHLFVYVDGEADLLEHASSAEDFAILRSCWDRFIGEYVKTWQPPPLTDGDTVVRTDEAWIAAAWQYIAMSKQADEAGDWLVEAKKRLLGLAKHTSEQSAGVAVKTFRKTGTVDYRRLVESLRIDPEPFRGPARQETRISFMNA